MALTNEEKGLIEEALALYLQLVSQQLPKQQVQQVAVMAQGIINKLDNLGAGGGGSAGNKPADRRVRRGILSFVRNNENH